MGKYANVDFFKETDEDRKYFIKPKYKGSETKWERDFNSLLQDYEVSLIKQALYESGGNIAKAARICGLKRTGLQTKVYKYGIDPEGFKEF